MQTLLEKSETDIHDIASIFSTTSKIWRLSTVH